MKKIELLAPVGDWGMLRSAISSGADSVYFGVKTLNMRAMAKNFEITELEKVVEFCHKNKVKAYLTVNTIVFEDELEDVQRVLSEAKKAKIDAIICWDLAVIKLAKKLKLDIHISTQASVANTAAALEYAKLGAKRIVLARECSLEQIKEITSKVKIEIEVFCHGAMCVSESGRCFMSQFLWNKSANRGECLHPCRRSYTITDEEGRELKLENDKVMSAKDLCTISFIDKLIASGVKCLKIEGRAKTPDYVAKVVSVYREAIDAKKPQIAKWESELKSVFNRGFSTGFFLGKPINEWSKELETTTKREFLGEVSKYYAKLSVCEVKLIDSLKIGDLVSIHSNKTPYFEQKVASIHADLNGKTLTVKKAEKGTLIAFKVAHKVREGDKLFKLIKKI